MRSFGFSFGPLVPAAIVASAAIVGTVEAAPTWIGVYGSYQYHDAVNPGTYTVLMNQDYFGLHCEVSIQVNAGSWNTYSMAYSGNDSGNSVWTHTPSSSIAPGSTVEYYFHGFDDWGANIWDNNGGSNYSYTAALIPSSKTGMGAWVDTGDTTFRVWAPNATTVSVTGTFNAWSATANPLAADTGGHWSVDVAGDQRGESYKYVIDGTLWKNDPRATDVTNSVGDSIVTMPDAYSWSSFTAPGWHDMVIYEMHVGTLNDVAGGNPGTWATATSKLAHIAAMGFNTVKVMPIAEFAGDFSWGYNPAHPFAPESIYGDPTDMKDFVDECHQLGIAVLIDVVYNHLGPSDLDMWRFDGSFTGSYGGIYFFQDWRAPTPWGHTRPDYGRAEVRQYLLDNAMYWLEEFNCDGLRWDSTVNIRTQNNGGGGAIAEGWSLMQEINDEIDSVSSWKISIAEDLQNDNWLTKTTGSGGAGFDSQWDSGFVHPIRDNIIVAADASRDMWAVKDAIAKIDNGDHLDRVVYTESHDEVANGKARVPEEIWPGNASSWASKKRSTLGAGLVFTSPGIPMIFQGQEFLEDEYFQDTDPLDWTKATTYSGIVDLYTDLVALRRNTAGKTAGLKGNNVNVHHVNNTNKLVAFHRWDSGGSGDDVIIVANFSGTGYSSYNIGFPSSGTWKVRFNSDWSGYDAAFSNWTAYDTTASWGAKDGMSYNANVGIGPYTVIILSKD
ncbi:MAG: 1,4-alpha-glucan branching enzyme [Phycisphaerales bacterium]|jgi:1,4-alpha-glucan branching enzyme